MMQPSFLMSLMPPGMFRALWFVLELLFADYIFWHAFDRKSFFPLRFTCCLLAEYAAVAVLFAVTETSALNNIVAFVFALAMSVAFGRICFDISWMDAVFCATVGYSSQFTASIISEFAQRGLLIARWPFEIFAVALVYLVLYFVFGKKLKNGQNLSIQRWFQVALLTAAAGTEIVICGILRNFWLLPENRTMMICSMIMLFLCSMSVLVLEFTLLQGKELSTELEVMSHLIERERQQYQFNRETIDTINRKCHDMRHQIRAIGSMEKLSPEAIKEMTDAINIYDHLYKTGSTALDTILAEKTLYCQQNRISLNVMADGEKLSFMRDSDIYSLFGNILENALQAVVQLPVEDRDIYLSIVPRGELLHIHQHNIWRKQITMQDGLPLTTNKDTMNHGIGTKSIRMIVQSYGGTVTFDTAQGEFSIMILFPLP